MESRSPSDSGGGGGRDGARPPPSPTSPPRAERRNSNHHHHHHHDNERPVPARASRPQPSPSSATMLSLDQIRVVARCSNEYTDGPKVAQKSTDTPPPGRHKVNNAVTPPSPGADDQAAETLEERSHDLLPPSHPGSTTSSTSGDGDENDQAVVRGSSNECSVSSLQRLMGGPHDGGGGEETIRTQPKRAERDAEERKPLAVVPGAGGSGGGGGEVKHSKRCGRCGRCSCGECTQRRVLPSCWLCGRRCVCSPQNAVENATCVCCVRGLFYHCSSDDEDTCVDKPFSCTQAHCCTRWTAVALLTVVLPCIACYLPAKTCMAACQHCYDMATRPGCRCKEGPRRGSRTATGHMVRCEAGEKPT
ncbi:unnamed protein product [Merluccius merluccius]